MSLQAKPKDINLPAHQLDYDFDMPLGTFMTPNSLLESKRLLCQMISSPMALTQ